MSLIRFNNIYKDYNFKGAVMVVSHDRQFEHEEEPLVFEGQGVVRPIWGNWATWENHPG